VTLPFFDLAGVSVVEAVDALEAALAGGLDPEAAPPRVSVPVGDAELLVMPAAVGGHAAVKLVTVGPREPRVQGVCVLFDASTLAPVSLVDGIALTNLRTAAVSALAVRRLAAPDARRVLVLGRGPQGQAHADAMRAIRPIEHVDIVGRDGPRDELVAAADIICCCTTAREPLFDGALVADHACVVAIGSHEPAAREVDETLVRRATVVVESRTAALREAGDVVAAGLGPDQLVTLSELVRGVAVASGRPRLFKSVGMAWEDTVVASLCLGRTSKSTTAG
jgi:ornithine cyclodeaminase/alanine dehydrogenase-like protein (mu-crystallin family)